MRLTTLRALVIATTALVAAAATCLATFADVPVGAPAAPAPTACARAALTFRDAGTSLEGTDATTRFVVENRGSVACLLERVPRLTAFDPAGGAVALVPPKRIGVMRFVLRPLALPIGGGATFTLRTAHEGPSCASIAKVSLAVGDGSLDVATQQIACARDDGSNASLSLFTTVVAGAPDAPRMPRDGDASSRATPL